MRGGRGDRGGIPIRVLMSNACPVYSHLPLTVVEGCLSLLMSVFRVPSVRYLFHIRWQLIAVLLPFEIILAHPLRLLIIVFCVFSVLFSLLPLVSATCRRMRSGLKGKDKGRGSLSALSNSNPAVECSSCFCQVQPAAVPSLYSFFLFLLL